MQKRKTYINVNQKSIDIIKILSGDNDMKGNKAKDFISAGLTQQQVFDLISKIPEINEKLDMALLILNGDPNDDKRKGLVEKLNEVDNRIHSNERMLMTHQKLIYSLYGVFGSISVALIVAIVTSAV